VLPAVIVDLTNEARADDSLGSLKRNPLLDEAAKEKAEDMAENGYFAHYSPDGVSPWHWLDAVGYRYTSAGENLAVHFTDSADVVDAWMNSPSHRENILDSDYTEIGVGTARGEFEGYPTVFVVQFFGLPAEAAAAAQTPSTPVENAAQAQTPAPASETGSEGGLVAAAESGPGPAAPATPSATLPAQAEKAAAAHDSAKSGSTVTEESAEAPAPTNIVLRTATQPHLWLRLVYAALALFVVIALALSIIIEWRRQHPVQIAYGAGLLAVMAILLFVQATVSAGVVIL
jgi:hypothetical protein